MARPMAQAAAGNGERWTRRPKRSRSTRATNGKPLPPPTV